MARPVTAALSAALVLHGCAYGTLINGSRQEVTFNSEPPGATVSIDGGAIGETPMSWKLPRNRDVSVVFEKTGCERREIPIDSSVSGIVLLNLLPFLVWGLAVGGAVDLISGGAYNLEPETVTVSLKCDRRRARPASTGHGRDPVASLTEVNLVQGSLPCHV